MRLSVACLILLLCCTAYGQKISKSTVLTDLAFLNEAVVNGHPVNYNRTDRISIDSLLQRVNALEEDSISVFRYRFILGSALQQIGCVHTSVTENPLVAPFRRSSWFPLKVMNVDNRLFVAERTDSLYRSLAGKELLAINGVSAAIVLKDLLCYSASDGGGKAFVQDHIRIIMPALLPLYFGYPESYTLRFADDTVTLREATVLRPEAVNKDVVPLLSNNGNTFTVNGKTGVLKLTSFSKSDRPFYSDVFEQLEKATVSNLIIDLRGNTGGNRKAAVMLTRHLVDTTFSYAILQPHLKTRKYLDGKGKFFLFLAKLRYNVGNVFKGRSTPLGREFAYRYHPLKSTYEGTLYVITDGLTGSSSTFVTSWLKHYTGAVFVGRQAGGGYNGNNGGTFPTITLPESGIQITFPAYRLILDRTSENARGIVPDIPVSYSIEELLQGNDKEMETIFRLLND